MSKYFYVEWFHPTEHSIKLYGNISAGLWEYYWNPGIVQFRSAFLEQVSLLKNSKVCNVLGEGLLSGLLVEPAQFYHVILKLHYFWLAVAPNYPWYKINLTLDLNVLRPATEFMP